MRAALLSVLASIATAGIAHADESKYVAVVNILATTGKFNQLPIPGTKNGVSRAECELRLKAWLAKNEAGFRAGIETLKAQGEYSEMSAECIRKD